jgi:hypothetical protein
MKESYEWNKEKLKSELPAQDMIPKGLSEEAESLYQDTVPKYQDSKWSHKSESSLEPLKNHPRLCVCVLYVCVCVLSHGAGGWRVLHDRNMLYHWATSPALPCSF